MPFHRLPKKKIKQQKHRTDKIIGFNRSVRVYEITKDDDSEEEEEKEGSKESGEEIIDASSDPDAGLNLDEKLYKRLKILDEVEEEIETNSGDGKLKRTSSGRLDWIRRSFSKKKDRGRPPNGNELNVDDDFSACNKATQTIHTSFAALNSVNKSGYTTRGDVCDCKWFSAARRRKLRRSVFRMQQQYFEHQVRMKIFQRPPDYVVQRMIRFKLLRSLIERIDLQEKGDIPKTSDCFCRQVARIYNEYRALFNETIGISQSMKPEEFPPRLQLFFQ